jgi:hypothetical protein
MVMTFDGMQYAYFGNFAVLRPEAALWRVRALEEIIWDRMGSIPKRMQLGIPGIDVDNFRASIEQFLKHLRTLVLVTSDEDRGIVQNEIIAKPTRWPVQVFALSDIATALQNVG